MTYVKPWPPSDAKLEWRFRLRVQGKSYRCAAHCGDVQQGEMMKSIVLVAVAAAGLAAAGAANAAGEADLAQKSGCMTCHAVDTKKMGPAFKDVAAKYKGKAEAEGTLVAALDSAKGHPKVKSSPDENKTLVKWILSM
jgi:cytochrome c